MSNFSVQPDQHPKHAGGILQRRSVAPLALKIAQVLHNMVGLDPPWIGWDPLILTGEEILDFAGVFALVYKMNVGIDFEGRKSSKHLTDVLGAISIVRQWWCARRLEYNAPRRRRYRNRDLCPAWAAYVSAEGYRPRGRERARNVGEAGRPGIVPEHSRCCPEFHASMYGNLGNDTSNDVHRQVKYHISRGGGGGRFAPFLENSSQAMNLFYLGKNASWGLSQFGNSPKSVR